MPSTTRLPDWGPLGFETTVSPVTAIVSKPPLPAIATLVTSATGRLVEVPSTVTTTWSPTTATVTSWLPPSARETVQVPEDETVGVVDVSTVGAVVTTGAVVVL